MSYVVRRSGRKLGTYRDARIAHAVAGMGYGRKMPEGWKVLGSGCYRTAVLSPKGIVYKVNQGGYDSMDDGDNYAEVMNICRLKSTGSVPKGWAIPDATLYRMPTRHESNLYGDTWPVEDYVVAMPLIDTSNPFKPCDAHWSGDKCMCHMGKGNRIFGGKCTTDILKSPDMAGFGDTNCGNVFPDAKGTLWLVDVGI